MWETRNDLLNFGDGNTAGNSWKQKLRPRAVVGYGVEICLPIPPKYVTRSPGGSLIEMAITFGQSGVACGFSNRKDLGVPFLLFLLLYWHVLSHLILPLETHIILTIFRNVKRDNRCRENTAIVID